MSYSFTVIERFDLQCDTVNCKASLIDTSGKEARAIGWKLKDIYIACPIHSLPL